MSYTQRETPILAQLCTFLVEDVYGELAARVFSVLARFGRQRLVDILRLSYLNRRQIGAGLVILVQQHLVARSSTDTSPTFYAIDWQHSYALVRCGRIAKLVEERFGSQAANVVSNLLTLGHTRISDLKDAYFPPDTDSDADLDDGIVNGVGTKRMRNGEPVNGVNGKVNGTAPGTLVNGDGHSNGVDSAHSNGTAKEHDGSIDSVKDLYKIVHKLMKEGWVIKLDEAQYLSAGDYHELARQLAIAEKCGGGEPTGTKQNAEIEEATLRHKRRIRDAWLEVPQTLGGEHKTNGSAYEHANKRVKINGDNDWSRGAFQDEEELVIRINPEKIAVAMRTEQLVNLVEQRLGPITARIYRIMLRSLETHIPRCFDEWADPSPAGKENSPIVEDDPQLCIYPEHIANLTTHLDICEGLDPQGICQITGRSLVKDKENPADKVLSQPVDPSKLSYHERKMVVEKHIELLTHDPFHFATWSGRGTFRIDFEEIAKALIQHELENTVEARKGPTGVKLIRALRKKGKLDERQTCNAMMMSANDIRDMVNDLTVQGFVQTQEIPKVDRREAKHSLHLVWYDCQRAREKLLHDTYKGMVRIMQRLAFERERVQSLLAKAERSDVVGNEDKYLTADELDMLKKWKEVQEKLLLQLFREDDLVATLRDFVGPMVSV
ncbi:hypothetical protein K458DRAFT_359936 [Lentithecium fluviatile CBS 122367]|uniref:DNA-directed RNA polymerase III subunit RPC3 n=1 Tax=Lentithecium fluviatile CBS 122367 TaxID=1168545 RepID=A0A6G1JED3_9PLEO|nr:hypothetical protein K458DRAFT_359936 [Lentithecium fluviatile CBS 122367]